MHIGAGDVISASAHVVGRQKSQRLVDSLTRLDTFRMCARGCLWQPVAPPWLPVAACGCPWLPVAALGWPWLAVAARGCPWLPLAARGCPWMPAAAPGCPCLSPSFDDYCSFNWFRWRRDSMFSFQSKTCIHRGNQYAILPVINLSVALHSGMNCSLVIPLVYTLIA